MFELDMTFNDYYLFLYSWNTVIPNFKDILKFIFIISSNSIFYKQYVIAYELFLTKS